MNCGIQNMLEIEKLPLIKHGVKTHYEGSIDKQGGNNDFDWWLYPDNRGEWVIFDVEGSGCIYNIVQHRYPDSPEVTFKFYFDDEQTPGFVLRNSQFGEVYPLLEPLASRYIGPISGGAGPIRVIRSFVPMPFKKSCRITTNVRLQGCARANGDGGWGHVIWQSYTSDSGFNVEKFDKNDDIMPLISLWKRFGTMPLSPKAPEKKYTFQKKLANGASVCIFDDSSAGAVIGIEIDTSDYKPEDLAGLKAEITFDGHEKADVDASFGCLFSNELGYNSVRYLMSGMSIDGRYYIYYPMPYKNSAVITIKNDGEREIELTQIKVISTREYNGLYENNEFGYFRSAEYHVRCQTPGSDSIIADIKGAGTMVKSIVTAFAQTPETYASCEGDVRIHFDGIRTPQIESDGSESYSDYGWGFPTPPECNPASGYDGFNHRNWSMERQLPGDWCPFISGMRFGIESGCANDYYLEHSGMVFYYGTDDVKLLCEKELIDTLGNETEKLTSFFEGDDDDIEVTVEGCYGKQTEYDIELPDGTDYVILRRVSDQKIGRQRAAVYVDGERVTAYEGEEETHYRWYFADHNPYKRLLEDEFTIPSRYVRGKKKIHVVVEPHLTEGVLSWNVFGMKALCVKF